MSDEPAIAGRRGARRGIQSIEIGFRIIDTLIHARNPLPLKEIAARAGLPASNAFYLVSLVKVGMVSPGSRYRPLRDRTYGLKIGIACLSSSIYSASRVRCGRARGADRLHGVSRRLGDHGPTIVYRVDGRAVAGLRAADRQRVAVAVLCTWPRVPVFLPADATAELLRAELNRSEPSPLARHHDVLTTSRAAELRQEKAGHASLRSALPRLTAMSAPCLTMPQHHRRGDGDRSDRRVHRRVRW